MERHGDSRSFRKILDPDSESQGNRPGKGSAFQTRSGGSKRNPNSKPLGNIMQRDGQY